MALLGRNDRLVEVLGSLAEAVRSTKPDATTSQRLADHMLECERRYQAFDKKSDERHTENQRRLTDQDQVLDKQSKAVTTLIVMAIGILLSTLSIFITVVVQGMHHT